MRELSRKPKGWTLRDTKRLIDDLAKGVKLEGIAKKMERSVEILEVKLKQIRKAPRFKDKVKDALATARKKRTQRAKFIGKSNMTLRKRKRKEVEKPRKKLKRAQTKVPKWKNVNITKEFDTPDRKRKEAKTKTKRKEVKWNNQNKTGMKKKGKALRKVAKQEIDEEEKPKSRKEESSKSKGKGKIDDSEDDTLLESYHKSKRRKALDETAKIRKGTADTPVKDATVKSKSMQLSNKIKRVARFRSRRRSDLGSRSQNFVVKENKQAILSKKSTSCDQTHAESSDVHSDKENEPTVATNSSTIKTSPEHLSSSESISPNLTHKYILKGKMEASKVFDPFGSVRTKAKRRTFSRKRQRQRLVTPPRVEKSTAQSKPEEIPNPKPKREEIVSDDSSCGTQDTEKSRDCAESNSKKQKMPTLKKTPCLSEVKRSTKKRRIQNNAYGYVESEDESESFCLAVYDDEDLETNFTKLEGPQTEEEDLGSEDECSRASWRLQPCNLPKNFFFQRYIDCHFSISRKFTEDPFA